MKSHGSCKGCGMAAIGLCRAGDTSMLLRAKNSIDAGVGDIVIVGLDRSTKAKGYFMAYIIPVLALISGAFAGASLGRILLMQLDVIGSFSALAAASFFSYRKLKTLDKTKMMEVKRRIGDDVFTGEIKSEEERWYPKYRA